MAPRQTSSVNKPLPRPWAFWLMLLAGFCLALTLSAMLWPGLFSSKTWSSSQVKKGNSPPVLTEDASLPLQDTERWKPRFPIKLSPAGTAPAPIATAPTAMDQPRNVPLPNNSPAIPATAITSPSLSLVTIVEPPSPSDSNTAKEFFALCQALTGNDVLTVHIALNDFLAMPDSCTPLLTRMAQLWLEQHLQLSALAQSRSVPIIIINPITKLPAKIIAVSTSELSLEEGLGTYHIPRKQLAQQTIAELWQKLALEDKGNSSISLLSVMAHWLVGDIAMSRVMMREYSTATYTTKIEHQSQAMILQQYVERWLALRWWNEGSKAVEQKDAATTHKCATQLSGLIRLGGHEWAKPYADYLIQANKERPATTLAQTPIVHLPNREQLAALGISAALTGTWNSTPQGARLTGEGSVILDGITSCKTIEVICIPRRYGGTMRISTQTCEWVIQVEQAMMAAKGPRGTIAPFPITFYPRHANSLRWSLGDKEIPMRLDINHDQGLPSIITEKRAEQLKLSFSTESDVMITAIRCVQ